MTKRSEMKKLINYSTGRIHDLYDLLKLDKSSYTNETFHKLRVEIKKIRFLLKLADFSEGKPERNTKIKEVDKLFKKAGALRDLQIMLPILKKHSNKNLFSSLQKSVNEQIEKRKKKFYRQLDKIKHESLKQDLLDLKSSIYKTDGDKLSAFEKYFKEKCIKLLRKGEKQRSAMSSPQQIKDEAIHSVRKILKLLTYCDKLNAKDDKKSGFEKLSNVIGKWHDYLICIEQLNEIKFSTKNASSLKNLIATLKNLASKSRAEILVQSKKSLFLN